MKIAILVHNLTGGGAERVAAMWATGLNSRGHVVRVFISDRNSPITYKLPEGIGLTNTDYQHRNKFVRYVKKILLLHNSLKEFRPDVTIEVSPRWKRRIAMIGVGGKKISTEHWSFERPKNAPVKPKKINKIYLNRLYDYVTVLTQADKDVIGEQLRNVTVLPNPLSLISAKEMPPKKKVVLAAGRLDAWYYKGFDILIKAWAQIADKADGWKLQIAGNSKKDGLKFLQNLCVEKGVADSVEFLGYQDDILPFYKDASIFVLSSRYEAFGLVLIEAMSQGCACVACDYKGRQKEIILSEENGLTCKPEDIGDLSRAMLSLIQDDGKREVIGKNAIIRSMDFNIDKITEKWEKIFDKVL